MYIDDILIFSDEISHLKDIEIFNILHEHNLKISASISVFNVTSLNDSKGLRRFLGMVGFYRELIPKYSEIILPYLRG